MNEKEIKYSKTILKYIRQRLGRDNAIKVDELMKLIPLTDREVRRVVQYLVNEGNTNLNKIKIPNLKQQDVDIYLKDESTNPTGSFKDRGMPLLMADVKKCGSQVIATVSTGNAAISLTKYAKKFGFKTMIFLPKDTPQEKIDLLSNPDELVFDSDLIESYEHFIRFCRKNKNIYMGFLAINIPYLQGVKTLAYEIFEQLEYKAPDWIIVPCGSGGNVISIYQGFLDLLEMGMINHMPRFVTVQIKGADPITVGYQKKQMINAIILENLPNTKASAIASDTCFNYKKIQHILHDTDGMAISVTDDEIEEFVNSFELEFSALSVFASVKKLDIHKGESVVIIGTARRK